IWAHTAARRSTISPTVGIVAHIGSSAKDRSVLIGSESARGPLPNVAGHIVQPVAIGLETVGCNCSNRATGTIWELPGECIHPRCPVGLADTAPRKWLLLQPTACSKFPFSLGQQPGARPLRIGYGIALGDMCHRMIRAIKHRRRVTGGVQPGSTENLTPPGRLTNRRGHRLQLWGQQTCKNQRIPMNLSICMVPGVLNKDRKFSVSDRGGRNSERGHPDFTHRPLAIFGVSFRGFT